MPISRPVGGVATGQLIKDEVLTVTAGLNALGRVVIFPGAQSGVAAEIAQDIADGASASFGPYATVRAIRVYTDTGDVTAETATRVPAITALEPAVISEDGKEISGQGAKPDSSVLVYNKDTSAPLGTAVADITGEWRLVLAVPLTEDIRVGYDVTIVAPYTSVMAQAQFGRLDLDVTNSSIVAALI